MDRRGRIIVLNGTSSAGKSTLARALQARLGGPWLSVGIDTVVFSLPKAYLDLPLWGEVFRYVPAEAGSSAPFRVETGELGHRLIDGLHRMVAGLADAGHAVIVDHVLVEPGWLEDLLVRVEGHEALMVGVRCPLDVLVARERDRRDRTVGQAAALFDVVHRGGYDVEVDTSRLSPEEAAEAVADVVEAGMPEVRGASLRRHVATRFDVDGTGRLVREHEVEGDPAPDVFIARGRDTVLAWFGAGVAEDRIAEVSAAVTRLPAWDGAAPPEHLYDEVAAALGSPSERSGGPAYEFAPPMASESAAAEIIDTASAHRLDAHFPWTARHLAVRAPVAVAVRDGTAVAACFSARRRTFACEAGVATVAAWQGRGLATAVVAAWREAVAASGAVPLYSTTWDNDASRGVARRLGLVAYADTCSLRLAPDAS